MDWYKKIVKEPWPYWVGGILIAMVNVVLFYFTGKPWAITTGFLYWGAGLLQIAGIDVTGWEYFQRSEYLEVAEKGFVSTHYTLLNTGIILGALLAVLMASQFKFKKLKNRKQFVVALIGGIIMGYSTRIAFGCNIGGFLSAIGSLSLHGWILGFSMLIGAWIGSKILFKYLI